MKKCTVFVLTWSNFAGPVTIIWNVECNEKHGMVENNKHSQGVGETIINVS